MRKVIYPIHIDNWNRSISSKLREIIRWSPERQCEFTFYSFSRPKTSEDRELAQDFWGLPNVRQVTPLQLVTNTYDIVHHATATVPNLAAALVARTRSLGRCCHIFTASVEISPEDAYYPHLARAVQLADIIIANSEAVANSVYEQFGRRVDTIIPNGVDADFFAPHQVDPGTGQRMGIHEPYVLFSGTVDQRKHPEYVVEVARLLPQVEFVMVGSYTPYADTVLRQAPSNVKYLGLVRKSHVRDLLGSASALLFPSEREGLPNAVLEAISMGVPVLARHKSSLPELVDTTTGYLLPDEQYAIWAERLQEIIHWSSDSRSRFSETARYRAVTEYSWATYSHRHFELYKECLR